MYNFLSRLKKRFSRPSPGVEPSPASSEMEQLTEQLLQEATAAIVQNFQRNMMGYEDCSQEKTEKKGSQAFRRFRRHKVLDQEGAKTILAALLRDAIVYRKMLAVRIERDVETGALFTRYYGKMQIINAQTIEAYEKLQIMDRDKSAFEYKQSVYKKLTKKIYQQDAIPGDTGTNPDGSSSSQAVDARDAVRALKRIPRRWDIFELLNLRKSVRMTQEEEARAAEDYLETRNTDLTRAKDAKAVDLARKEAAEAAKAASLAKAEAERARTEEAKAVAGAARANILAEAARTDEAKALAEAAQVRSKAETEQAGAEMEATQAKAEAEAAKARAETEAAQAKAGAEVAKARAETEAAQAKAGAEAAQAKAGAEAAKARAQAETEAAQAKAGAEVAKARAETEAAQAKAGAEAEIARARAEAEARIAGTGPDSPGDIDIWRLSTSDPDAPDEY